MPQKITTRYQALVDTAEREIETLSVEEALALFGRDDVTFIDSPYHNRFLRKTSALSSLASAACVRRWRRKRRSAWVCVRSRTSEADLARGAMRTARWNRRRPSRTRALSPGSAQSTPAPDAAFPRHAPGEPGIPADRLHAPITPAPRHSPIWDRTRRAGRAAISA